MSWHYSPANKQLTHSSGVCLEVQSVGPEPQNISPLHIPGELNALQLAKLIREGMDYYREVQQDRLKTMKKPTGKRPILRLNSASAL